MDIIGFGYTRAVLVNKIYLLLRFVGNKTNVKYCQPYPSLVARCYYSLLVKHTVDLLQRLLGSVHFVCEQSINKELQKLKNYLYWQEVYLNSWAWTSRGRMLDFYWSFWSSMTVLVPLFLVLHNKSYSNEARTGPQSLSSWKIAWNTKYPGNDPGFMPCVINETCSLTVSQSESKSYIKCSCGTNSTSTYGTCGIRPSWRLLAQIHLHSLHTCRLLQITEYPRNRQVQPQVWMFQFKAFIVKRSVLS